MFLSGSKSSTYLHHEFPGETSSRMKEEEVQTVEMRSCCTCGWHVKDAGTGNYAEDIMPEDRNTFNR
jgi:hypothetical protein